MAVTAPDAAQDDEVHRAVSTALDVEFYRAVNPDVDWVGDFLRHYEIAGWREGRDPAPWFSTTAYLKTHPDVAEAGWEPFSHYLTRGWREGRDVQPSVHARDYLFVRADGGQPPPWRFRPQPGLAPGVPPPAPEPAPAAAEEDLALLEAHFDRAFYLKINPDVAACGVDPLEHFRTIGWRERRDPCATFSVHAYLESHADVVAADVNPFVHYLREGRLEGRRGAHDLGFRYDILKDQKPLKDRLLAVFHAQEAVTPQPATALRTGLQASRSGLKDLHVTVSHDDYTAHLGGVQLCLRREAAGIAAQGADHLHLFPAKAWPVLRGAGEPGPLGVLWNGQPLGAFAPRTIAEALAAALEGIPAGRRSFAIHSMLGHNPDETADILAAAGQTAGFFWLHDFASLCAGFHLMRNDVEDCGAPRPDSAACGICIYGGEWRARHLSGHERLFERLDLTVVSPSEPTLELWRDRWRYPARDALVHPHVRLTERGPAPPPAKGRPFRLAYAGFPAAHKGWPIFKELALKHAGDERYAFLHLGDRTPGALPIDFHQASVSEARPHAMRETLEALEVDAVLIWPLCRETFSLLAHEAVAAGAAVVTGPDSGNVAAFVRATGHGCVLPDEQALATAVETGEIMALGRAERRAILYDLTFSALTADLLPGAPTP